MRQVDKEQTTITTTTSSGIVTFTLGMITGCTIATVVTVSLYTWRRKHQLRSSTPNENNSYENQKIDTAPINQLPRRTMRLTSEIREEQLSRHTLYFGTDGMDKLKRSKVCIIGVGGVGSHTAHMIARSGIGYIRIIDFDQVSVSSLNRHACATLHDVGISKVQCLTNYLQEICPNPQYLYIEPIAEMYTAESGLRLLRLPSNEKWDMVIDCIDDVKTKAALLGYCIHHKIPVLSCMGAGGKADPTRLHISDMRSAAKDPLASKIRQYLKSYMKKEYNTDNDTSYLDNMDQLTILYNSEKTVVKLADFTSEQKDEGVHNFGAVDGMRIRVVPVLGTMPAIMGQALASYCLTVVAGNPDNLIQPVTTERIGRNSRNKMYQTLRTREQNISAKVRCDLEEARRNGQKVNVEETQSVHGTGELITIYSSNNDVLSETWIGELQIDQSDDMDYLLEIWRNRCAITGARLGTTLHVVRWDRSQPSTCDNLIVICANVLKQYESNPMQYQQEKIDPFWATKIILYGDVYTILL